MAGHCLPLHMGEGTRFVGLTSSNRSSNGGQASAGLQHTRAEVLMQLQP